MCLYGTWQSTYRNFVSLLEEQESEKSVPEKDEQARDCGLFRAKAPEHPTENARDSGSETNFYGRATGRCDTPREPRGMEAVIIEPTVPEPRPLQLLTVGCLDQALPTPADTQSRLDTATDDPDARRVFLPAVVLLYTRAHFPSA